MVFIHSPKALQNSNLFVVCLLFVAGFFQFKFNPITLEKGLWNVSLTLLCYLRTGKYLMGCQVSGLACDCVMVSVLCMFTVVVILTPGPNGDLLFYCFSFERCPQMIGTVLFFANFTSIQSHSSVARRINSVKILFRSKSVILVTNKFKSDQRNQIFKEF